jgi:hypothetical protein
VTRYEDVTALHEECTQAQMRDLTHREAVCAATGLATALLAQLEQFAWGVGNPESRRAILKLGKSMHDHAVTKLGSKEKMSPAEPASAEEMREWYVAQLEEKLTPNQMGWIILSAIAMLEKVNLFERSLAQTILTPQVFEAWLVISDLMDELNVRFKLRN